MQFEYASAAINPVVESIMFEYDPVYNLLDKYVYDVDDALAREPAITDPVAPTRDCVAPVLARTARFVRVAVVLLRDFTVRVAPAVERVAVAFERDARGEVVVRAETVRVPVAARDVFVCDTGCCETERDVVARDVRARFVVVLVERGLVRGDVFVITFCGAIGSANTERIDINVEQTKNAATKRNIVPIAFFNEFIFIRNVITISCCY